MKIIKAPIVCNRYEVTQVLNIEELINMRILLFTILAIFISISTCFAVDVNLQWNQSSGADGYKCEKSLDSGATWVDLPALTVTTFTEGSLNLARTTITVEDSVLVLVRIAAYNNVGETWQASSGIFVNTAWTPDQPPDSPSRFGVE